MTGERVTFGPSPLRRRGGEVGRLVLHRLAAAVPLVVLVSLALFGLAAVSPLDPLRSYLGAQYTTIGAEGRAQLARALGLDQDWFTAWWVWVSGLVTGDWGFSRTFGQPVAQVIAERLPFTVLLSAIGMLIAVLAALVLGVAAGMHPHSWWGRAVAGMAVIVQSVPAYVVAMAGILVFALGLGILPAGGAAPPGRAVTWAAIGPHLVLPACVLALTVLPWMLLSVRSSVRSALAGDPVAFARARGLPVRTVVWGHVVPVSAAPLVTLVGVRLPEIVVGAVLVEEVFAWPGIASATVAAARDLDLALLATLGVGTTAVVLLGSLLADACYLLLDPRVTA